MRAENLAQQHVGQCSARGAGSCGQLEQARGLFRAVSLIVSPAQPGDHPTSPAPPPAAPAPTPCLIYTQLYRIIHFICQTSCLLAVCNAIAHIQVPKYAIPAPLLITTYTLFQLDSSKTTEEYSLPPDFESSEFSDFLGNFKFLYF